MFTITDLINTDAYYTNQDAAVALYTAQHDDEATHAIYGNVAERIERTTQCEPADMEQEWALFSLEVESHYLAVEKLHFLATRNAVAMTGDQINQFLAMANGCNL